MEGGRRGRTGNNAQPPVKTELPSAIENVITLPLPTEGRIAVGRCKKPNHVTREEVVQV